MDVDEIVRGLLNGNRRALARAITLVENDYPEGKDIMKRIFKKTGKAHVIGITGFPGVGKSTIVSKLTQEFRMRGKTVGIIAVDPGSPFSGGALLGDRLRMDGIDVNKRLWLDSGVFFRSMSSRGKAGGLSAKTGDVVRLMDAFGFNLVIVETVGAGQSEVDIIEVADTSIVVLMPETGDDIQINKAGILEIGDIYVVNKADLGGAEKTVKWLKSMLLLDDEAVRILEKMDHGSHNESVNDEILTDKLEKKAKDAIDRWIPPVIMTIADIGEGIKELADTIEKHREFMEKSGMLKKRRTVRVSRELLDLIMEDVKSRIINDTSLKFEEFVNRVVENEIDPHTAAEKIIEKLIFSKNSDTTL